MSHEWVTNGTYQWREKSFTRMSHEWVTNESRMSHEWVIRMTRGIADMNEAATREKSVPLTGWWRLIRCLNLNIIFRKRTTNYRALLRETTYEDKITYDSTPPCTTAKWHTCATYIHASFTWKTWLVHVKNTDLQSVGECADNTQHSFVERRDSKNECWTNEWQPHSYERFLVPCVWLIRDSFVTRSWLIRVSHSWLIRVRANHSNECWTNEFWTNECWANECWTYECWTWMSVERRDSCTEGHDSCIEGHDSFIVRHDSFMWYLQRRSWRARWQRLKECWTTWLIYMWTRLVYRKTWLVHMCVAVCCSVLQCVAVCCSVLQCVAVCCSVLQCVAVCCL